jgi:dipeptide/tripeptide permease
MEASRLRLNVPWSLILSLCIMSSSLQLLTYVIMKMHMHPTKAQKRSRDQHATLGTWLHILETRKLAIVLSLEQTTLLLTSICSVICAKLGYIVL